MIITPEHYEYLYIQRGEVSDVAKKGFSAWKAAYEGSLDAIMANIAPVLPPTEAVDHILDVGAGLGGIGIHLSHRYPAARYSLLDGVDDEPVVESHHKTFSNAAVAADFLTQNGVDHCFYSPGNCDFRNKFNLVVSFAAWGFHIRPGDYLDDVRKSLAKKATIILDVRKTREDWLAELCEAFGKPDVLERGKKHVRLAWTTA